MEAAETAAHRVLERWRAESSRDPLLDAEAAAAAAGGDGDNNDERATAARILAAREAVEKADADAIAAIPDEDVAGLIRTEEEAAVVKAMAAPPSDFGSIRLLRPRHPEPAVSSPAQPAASSCQLAAMKITDSSHEQSAANRPHLERTRSIHALHHARAPWQPLHAARL